MDVRQALIDIPDLTDWDDIEPWVNARLDMLARSSFPESVRSTFVSIDVRKTPQSALGSFASPVWRKLALSAFLADWACYPQPVDRADFARMSYVMGTFPTGFRIWFCPLEDGCFTPVGYTGWYPVSPGIVSTLLHKPETVTHRGFIAPLPALEDTSYLYLFNASIVRQLRGGTHQSSLLMRRFAEDIAAARTYGLLSITVSEDGARFSRRFGMEHVGAITVHGIAEQIYFKAEDLRGARARWRRR